MAYPIMEGKKGKALSAYASPLNIEANKGDTMVPQNDMAGVAPGLQNGGIPDPMNFLGHIEKGSKK